MTDLQWHVCLREPGAYFASLFAQLQHHVYADSLALFVEAMKRGAVFMADPHAGGEGTPFWAYCFDHDRYLSDFARMVPGDLVVHDYREADPFPTWRMLDSLGVLDVLTELPDAAARNARLRDDQVLAGYMDRVADALGDAVTISPELCAAVDQAISASAAHVPVYADAIAQRFAQSHARALDHGRALTGALATTAD